MKSSHLQNYLIRQSCGFVRSHDIIFTFTRPVSGHQLWQGGSSLGGASTHKFLQFFTSDHVTNEKYISTITMLMVTTIIRVVMLRKWDDHVRSRDKLNTLYLQSPRLMDAKGKLVTYNERLRPLKPRDPLIRWPTWACVKNLYYHIHKTYDH